MYKIVKSKNLIIPAILVMLVFLAFEPIRSNDFIDYDDTDYLTKNPFVQSGLTIQSVQWAFTTGHASNWHPLTWLSHMLDVTLFGMNPLWHHLHNVLLHTASTVLLFLLLKNMSGATWRSAFVAMVFGLHPLRVESVVWASERKDVLCMFLMLLTIGTYLYYVSRGGTMRYLLVILCFALSLMAKPMAVTLPLILLLLDIWPLKRMNASRWMNLISEKIPLLILTAISCLITFNVQKSGGSVWVIEDLSLPTRLSNAAISYVTYLGKMLWPTRLAVLYPYQTNLSLRSIITASVILAAVTFLALRLFRKRAYLAVGWLWYLITLVPVIGLVQAGSQAMADRYTYLPLIGVSIMIVWSAAQFIETWKSRKIVTAALAGALALLMIILVQIQLYYWKDSITLYEHTLAVTRDNYIIFYNLGNTLARQGRTDEAQYCLRKVLDIDPDNLKAHNDIAVLFIKDRQYREATEHLDKALRLKPDDAETHNNIGALLITRQQYEQAEYHLRQSLQANPKLVDAHSNLAQLLMERQQYDEALKHLQATINLTPNNVEAYNKMAFILTRQSKYDDAVQSLLKAVELSPDNAGVYFNIALLFQLQGKEKEAVTAYRQSIEHNPNNDKGLNGLAWILATTPDRTIQNSAEAVRLAETACRLTANKNPEYLKTLAATYAKAGQFDKAIQTAQMAIHLARDLGLKSNVEEITGHLHLYQNGKTLKEAANDPNTDITRPR